MTRIYDDANHPCYGTVRRCWIMLAGLGMLDDVDETYPQEWGYKWDEHIEYMLNLGVKEDVILRRVIYCAIMVTNLR